MYIRFAFPYRLVSPVRRGLWHVRSRGICCAGVPNGQLHSADFIWHRVKHRQIIRAYFSGSIQRTIGINSRLPAIGGNKVMKICLRVGPIPLCDNYVSFQALRTRWCFWYFSLRDAGRPVGKHFKHFFPANAMDRRDHRTPCLTGL